MLVETAVGQRRREARELAVLHRDVLVSPANLRNPRQLAGDRCLTGDTDAHRRPRGMVLPGHDLQPMTRHLVAATTEQHAAVPGVVTTDVNAVALLPGLLPEGLWTGPSSGLLPGAGGTVRVPGRAEDLQHGRGDDHANNQHDEMGRNPPSHS